MVLFTKVLGFTHKRRRAFTHVQSTTAIFEEDLYENNSFTVLSSLCFFLLVVFYCGRIQFVFVETA